MAPYNPASLDDPHVGLEIQQIWPVPLAWTSENAS